MRIFPEGLAIIRFAHPSHFSKFSLLNWIRSFRTQPKEAEAGGQKAKELNILFQNETMDVFLSTTFKVDRTTMSINMKSLYTIKAFKYFRFEKEEETKSSSSSISDKEIEQSSKSDGGPQEGLVSL